MSTLDDFGTVTSLGELAPRFTQQGSGLALVVVNGPDAGMQMAVEAEPVVIGSDPSSDWVLTDRTISRQQLQSRII